MSGRFEAATGNVRISSCLGGCSAPPQEASGGRRGLGSAHSADTYGNNQWHLWREVTHRLYKQGKSGQSLKSSGQVSAWVHVMTFATHVSCAAFLYLRDPVRVLLYYNGCLLLHMKRECVCVRALKDCNVCMCVRVRARARGGECRGAHE